MSHKRLTVLIGCLLAVVQGLNPPSAHAVGNGVPFVFREGLVPGAMAHPAAADSMDFTYHSCVDFTDFDSFTESGYLWISSFQDAVGVVDSQINDFLANGYHIYARYSYQADECGSQDTCDNGLRRNYGVNQAGLALYLDPAQDTVLGIANCAVTVAGNGDDVPLGSANMIQEGQKSETNDLANGDFEIVFVDWAFSNPGQALFRDGNGNALDVHNLVFNGNVTLLGGGLNNDHRPEGSGNLYWLD